MKVRNIVRKAASLAAGSSFVGATLMGAMAYDLANYPEGFIADGMFDGVIVVGERASTSDVVGSIDIAASLQASSTVEVAAPGASGRVELVGEGYELQTGSDQLELREPIGDVVDTVSEYELPGLTSGRITTSEGSTEFFQYLRFKDGTNLQNMTVNYVENDDNEMSPYLVVETNQPFMEWEIQFPEGLESERDSANELEDIQDKSFNILGQDFTVVKAEVTAGGGSFEMILMGGSIADTLREGETRTYSIDGVDYEVTLVFVSDPNSGTVEAKFSVNGELTDSLSDAETDTLSGGLQIGVRDILVNAREGVASFFLGADKIEITDSNTNTSDFTTSGSIEINNQNINDGDVEVQGADVGSDKFEITGIKYRLTMDPDRASTLYVPPGHGIKEFMRRPESLISESLDVFFAGLEEVQVTPVEVRGRGDDAYDMVFTNIQGREYRFPLITNEDGVFKFGDDDDDLVFVESGLSTLYNIGDDDYFIVSNDRGTDSDKSVTNVLRYSDYDDTDFTVELIDLSTDGTLNVPISTGGTGSLVIGGHTYQVNVSNRTANAPNLAIDLNADGDYADNTTPLNVTAWGGVIISLADAVFVTNGTVTAITDFPSIIGNGNDMEGLVGSQTDNGEVVSQSFRVIAKNFDSSTTDETFVWNVTAAASNQVDISTAAAHYNGPLEGDVPGDGGSFQFDEPSNDLDDWRYGMTDWGILIKENNPDDSDEPNELFLEVPNQQRNAQVFVTLGSTSTRPGGGSTTTQVNPIAVGLAVLDRNAPAVGTENLLVVGGPCANTVAAELLGNPANCAEGFEAGKAIIRAWDRGSTVAILVAGYEAQETLGASRVLAQYEDYSLSGSEVEVVVADLNSITVQAPSASAPEAPAADDNESEDMENETEA